MSRGAAIAAGMAITAVAFLLPLTPVDGPAGVRLLPVLAAALALAGGVPVGAWLLCAGLGLASAAAVWLLHRRGLLTPPAAPVAMAAAR
ncbi:hypothetical protein ACPFP2_21765 [Micromonospora citrea]|uniref:hypothetical protein n=1 Tax=Micromonospora citrea TaxID=47855 RepID=UPI003C44EDF3